jgi:fengycin family lipopeptide synthetase B
MMSLLNKSILITGGGRGLGRIIAVVAALEGAFVTILSRTAGELKTVEDRIQKEGGNCHSIVADVSDPHAVQHAVKQTVAHYKTIDIKAGIIQLTRSLSSELKDAMITKFSWIRPPDTHFHLPQAL